MDEAEIAAQEVQQRSQREYNILHQRQHVLQAGQSLLGQEDILIQQAMDIRRQLLLIIKADSNPDEIEELLREHRKTLLAMITVPAQDKGNKKALGCLAIKDIIKRDEDRVNAQEKVMKVTNKS